MSKSSTPDEKVADPRLEAGVSRFAASPGKNPFQLDSKEPDWSKFQGGTSGGRAATALTRATARGCPATGQSAVKGTVRYTSLKKENPEAADSLFLAAEANAKWRYNGYKRLASFAEAAK